MPEAKRSPGRPSVDEKGSRVSTWIPSSDHDKLIKAAKAQDVTISALVRIWLKLKLQ